MENEIKIKVCKLCGSSDNKFAPHRHQCTKCLSKIKNEKARKNNYWKTYYENNKDTMLESARFNYQKKKNAISV